MKSTTVASPCASTYHNYKRPHPPKKNKKSQPKHYCWDLSAVERPLLIGDRGLFLTHSMIDFTNIHLHKKLNFTYIHSA